MTKRIAFTKAAIDALKPPESGRVYVYDSKAPGLCVCVTKAGSKTLYIYRKVNGRPERIRLAAWPEITVEQARKHAQRYGGMIADGKNPNDVRRTQRKAPTLQEMFEEYLELPTRTKAKRPKSAKTIYDYRLQMKSYLVDWKNRKLSTISKADIEKRHNHLATENGYYIANRVLALLKAVYNAAIDLGYYDANPASRLRPFREESRERFLQLEELPRFWQALESEPNDALRDFVKLALWTGQRKSNVLSMRWQEVNLQQGVWTIPKTKTGKHEVPLTSEAVEVLRQRAGNGSEYVFPGQGTGHQKDVKLAWSEFLKRAGIKDLRIHDLRRSLGSWQAITGSSLSVIGKTLGHSQPSTTAIYARLSENPVRASMELATKAMLAAAKEGGGNGKR